MEVRRPNTWSYGGQLVLFLGLVAQEGDTRLRHAPRHGEEGRSGQHVRIRYPDEVFAIKVVDDRGQSGRNGRLQIRLSVQSKSDATQGLLTYSSALRKPDTQMATMTSQKCRPRLVFVAAALSGLATSRPKTSLVSSCTRLAMVASPSPTSLLLINDAWLVSKESRARGESCMVLAY